MINISTETASYPCGGRSLESCGKRRNSPRIQEFHLSRNQRSLHREANLIHSKHALVICSCEKHQTSRGRRGRENETADFGRVRICCVCSLAVSGDGEEAASHRDEALKLQSDEKKVQGRTRGGSFCLRQREASSS